MQGVTFNLVSADINRQRGVKMSSKRGNGPQRPGISKKINIFILTKRE